MNKRYLHNQCPDSICSVYFPSSLQTQKNWGVFFHLLTLQAFSLGIPGAAVHHHVKMERGRREKEWTGRNTDTALGRLCTSHTENTHTRNEGFCFLALLFASFFFFNYKNHIIPAKAGCAKVVFKNDHSVWLSSCRQASYWSISH